MWSEASCSDYVLTRSLSGDCLAPRGSGRQCFARTCSVLVPPLLTLLWSHLLPTRPARRPAPHASDTSPGVTPPSGPRLISVCIQPHPGLGGRWAQRSMVGAVSSARIRRPGRDAGVPVRSPRRTSAPRAKLPLSIHVRSGPFSSCCAALLAVAPLVMGSGRLPLGQGLDFSFPPSLLLLLGRLSARPPLFSLPDAPFSCPQLDAFSISLNVPSPVVRRTRPPDLACSWA